METKDQEMAKFLDGVIGVVDATSYEAHALWGENNLRLRPLTWSQNNGGFLEVVGELADMPVCISLITTTVAGHKLLFVHPTSQVVDHRMIDEWLKTTLPKSAFRDDGYINRTDAMNFHNIFPRDQRTFPLAPAEQGQVA